MQVFEAISNSTGLKVNPSKCKVFFGNVSEDVKKRIQHTTKFTEGCLPFKYIGIPLTSRKLHINHYMPLIDKVLYMVN